MRESPQPPIRMLLPMGRFGRAALPHLRATSPMPLYCSTCKLSPSMNRQGVFTAVPRAGHSPHMCTNLPPCFNVCVSNCPAGSSDWSRLCSSRAAQPVLPHCDTLCFAAALIHPQSINHATASLPAPDYWLAVLALSGSVSRVC